MRFLYCIVFLIGFSAQAKTRECIDSDLFSSVVGGEARFTRHLASLLFYWEDARSDEFLESGLQECIIDGNITGDTSISMLGVSLNLHPQNLDIRYVVNGGILHLSTPIQDGNAIVMEISNPDAKRVGSIRFERDFYDPRDGMDLSVGLFKEQMGEDNAYISLQCQD